MGTRVSRTWSSSATSSGERAQNPPALMAPWPRMEQECPDEPRSLPLSKGRKSLFLVDGTSQVERRASVLGDPSCGWFPLWTEEGALAGTA